MTKETLTATSSWDPAGAVNVSFVTTHLFSELSIQLFLLALLLHILSSSFIKNTMEDLLGGSEARSCFTEAGGRPSSFQRLFDPLLMRSLILLQLLLGDLTKPHVPIDAVNVEMCGGRDRQWPVFVRDVATVTVLASQMR